MRTKICDLLGIDYPIFQGAMARIADSGLAGAVSEAGGLGIIAAGNATGFWLQNEIRKAKAMTGKPFGVNIMLLSPYVDEVVEVICQEKVPVVTLGAGDSGKYMEALHKSGTKIIPVVPSVAFAKRMAKMGADALIAEGNESGGHVGKQTTMALLPQVVDAVSIPVLGAGGIADGRGMAAAFMLGASGVQVGTRFLMAYECNIHKNYKKAILKAKDIDTVVTGQVTGHPVRVLRNKLTRRMEELEKQEIGKPDFNLEEYNAKFDQLGRGALARAVEEGDVDNGSLMSGQIAGLCNKEQSCKEIIEELISGCQACFNKFSAGTTETGEF